MPKANSNNTEPEITNRIKKEKRRIIKIFAALDDNKKRIAEKSIYHLAVCTVTLERLADEINKGEVIELFEQGAQKIRRENPALKAYNATVKSFSMLSKTLIDLLPPEEKTAVGEKLLEFISKK